MRIVQRQLEDEMPKCEVIFERALNINIESIEKTYSLFNQFCQYEINRDIMNSAFEIASKINFGKNINDIIHLKFAEQYCSKLLTFDKDFKLLKQFSKIEIDIIDCPD